MKEHTELRTPVGPLLRAHKPRSQLPGKNGTRPNPPRRLSIQPPEFLEPVGRVNKTKPDHAFLCAPFPEPSVAKLAWMGAASGTNDGQRVGMHDVSPTVNKRGQRFNAPFVYGDPRRAPAHHESHLDPPRGAQRWSRSRDRPRTRPVPFFYGVCVCARQSHAATRHSHPLTESSHI